MHATIEEEIYYPAFLEATEEKDLHHEAAVEHEGAKRLIAEIEASGPDDEYFDAKVTVLSEMIKHHVKEEEQPGGLFAKSRQSEMDLDALGEQLASRKAELMNDHRPRVRVGRRAATCVVDESACSRWRRFASWRVGVGPGRGPWARAAGASGMEEHRYPRAK